MLRSRALAWCTHAGRRKLGASVRLRRGLDLQHAGSTTHDGNHETGRIGRIVCSKAFVEVEPR